MRPKVSVFLGVSLDGYIAGDNHSLEWMKIVETDPPEDAGYTPFMASVDALVLGRNSYDAVIGFTPYPYSGKRVVVLTTRPAESKHGETFYSGSLEALLETLALEGVRHVYLDGGNAVRQGLETGVVDTLTISTLPIILGSGIALFERGLPQSRWTLTSSCSFDSGLVQATYQRR
jgi:dihydrofolate reductase